MLFSKIFAAGALMASTAMAALSPAQIADGLKRITDQSRELQAPAQSITIVNAPLIIIGQGPFPQLIRGFTGIVTTPPSPSLSWTVPARLLLRRMPPSSSTPSVP
ncbi:hypothetical protein RRF57_002634 [Xylaria bambusicola]|uniref:Uncharacterized protein n=1 Tax=Xylaria bambusicola TaxID=326684 RepID=A0AAN7UDF2_9PEZI